MRSSIISIVLMAVCGCGVYSFTSTSIPAHLDTISVPLLINSSMESGVAEEITYSLSNRMQDHGLKSVKGNGDAIIEGEVLSYENKPYEYTANRAFEVDVKSYVVRVSVRVEFRDEVKDKVLYSGRIKGEGIYNFNTEDEETGMAKAIDDVVQQIIDNSVTGW
ncbi:MAG: LPS assembly lipoprotein LptE [Chitinivibrionales bacterium]